MVVDDSVRAATSQSILLDEMDQLPVNLIGRGLLRHGPEAEFSTGNLSRQSPGEETVRVFEFRPKRFQAAVTDESDVRVQHAELSTMHSRRKQRNRERVRR